MNEKAGRVMSVRTDLVRDHLVGGILERAEERPPAELPEPLADAFREALATAGGGERAARADPEATALAARLARVGYHSRAAEVEAFAPARGRAAWLSELLDDRRAAPGEAAWYDAAVELSAELARAEPDERPDPAHETASWRVPGPGGHVRHYVALAAAAKHGPKDQAGNPVPPTGIASAGQLKRCWLFGFLLHCCEETRQPD